MSLFPKLVCDGISITARDRDPSQVIKVCERLQKLSEGRSLDRFKIRSGHRSRFVLDIPIPGGKKSKVRFEVGPKHSNLPDYRFGLNFDKLGKEGISAAIQTLDSLTEGRTREIVRGGHVTRCDVAIDVRGCSLKDAVARSKGHQIHGVYCNRHGEPKTSYLGSPRSNCLVIYDKADGTESGLLRIEKRRKRTGPVSDLASMPNPFSSVQLVAVQAVMAKIGNVDPELFLDRIRVRGLTRALKELGRSRKRAVEKVLRDPSQRLIPFDQVWADWPQLLESYGLGRILDLPLPALGTAIDGSTDSSSEIVHLIDYKE